MALSGVPKPLLNALVTSSVDYLGFEGATAQPIVMDGLTAGASAAISEEVTGGVVSWINGMWTVPSFVASNATSLTGAGIYTLIQRWLLFSSPAGGPDGLGNALTLFVKYWGEDFVAKYLKYGSIGLDLGEDGVADLVAAQDPLLE